MYFISLKSNEAILSSTLDIHIRLSIHIVILSYSLIIANKLQYHSDFILYNSTTQSVYYSTSLCSTRYIKPQHNMINDIIDKLIKVLFFLEQNTGRLNSSI